MNGPRPVTPEDAELAVALAATSTTELLTKAYALTHRLHDLAASAEIAKRHVLPGAANLDQQARDLRAQRDLLTAEILRRAGEQP